MSKTVSHSEVRKDQINNLVHECHYGNFGVQLKVAPDGGPHLTEIRAVALLCVQRYKVAVQ